jgi:hypothetical protein
MPMCASGLWCKTYSENRLNSFKFCWECRFVVSGNSFVYSCKNIMSMRKY